MSIVTYVEVEQDMLFPVDNPWGSKMLDGFLISALHYCDLAGEGLPRAGMEDWQREVVDWFGPVARAMKKDLRVLSNAWYGSWPYGPADYERYLADHPDLPAPLPEEFQATCREVEDKWTDIRALRRVIDALIDALEQVCPPEIWWYDDPDTPEALAELSDVLSAALEAGCTRARLTSR